VRLRDTQDQPTTPGDLHHDQDRGDPGPPMLVLAWAAQTFSAVKGILHTPEPAPSLNSELRDGLLTAIAKARGWVDDLLGDRVASFADDVH
jgi:site-specific DNA recombinase